MWQNIIEWLKHLFDKDNNEPETPTTVTNAVEVSATVVKPSEDSEVKAVALKVSGSYDKATRAITIKGSIRK